MKYCKLYGNIIIFLYYYQYQKERGLEKKRKKNSISVQKLQIFIPSQGLLYQAVFRSALLVVFHPSE
jgi:hypothetical protein